MKEGIAMRESRGFESLVVGLAGVGLAASCTLIFDDALLAKLLFRNEIIQTSKIGTVTKSRSDVRRRVVQNLAWLPLADKTSVFEGDSIFTGQQSEAEISLEAGGKVFISANSMVVLSLSSGETNLDVQYGSIIGQLTEKNSLKVKLNGQVAELSGKNAKIEIHSDGDDTELAVLDGELEVKSGTKKNTLKKSENVRVTSAGKILEDSTSKVELIEPVDESSLWIDENEMVHFRWDAPNTEKHFVVEIARDSKFQDMLIKQAVNETEWKPTNLATLGRAYWRVRSPDRHNAVSKPFALTVHGNTAPVLVSPANTQVLTLDHNPDGSVMAQKSVPLSWDDASENAIYDVQMAITPDFSGAVQDYRADQKHLASPPLVVGTYYWRVHAVDPNRSKAPWSEPANFVIQTPIPQKPPPLPSPALALANSDIELESRPDAQQFAQLSPIQQKEMLKSAIVNSPKLSWRAIDGARGYQVEIAHANDPGFTNPVYSHRTKATELVWNKPATGQYAWRVRALNANLEPGDPSKQARLSLSVAPPHPVGGGNISDQVPTARDQNRPLKDVSLQWNPTPFSDSYEVEVSRTPDFAAPERHQTQSTQLSVRAPQVGNTYWRVRPLDASGNPVGRFSSQETFEYKRTVGLAPPVLVQPRQKTSLIFVGTGKSNIIFEWAKVEGSSGYSFEVAASPDFANVLVSQNLKINKTLIDQDLATGQYYWRVKAHGGQADSPWSDANAFSLSHEVRAPAQKNQ